ncbi:hypothetical protein BC941DRAFT_427605 [Chlamydoabsidia padenii]|nr:hypothetical protein BC941DRAFT_427605 [Chlamydoabsidia padenii]
MGFSGAVISIDLENDHLIMHGSAHESPGCVLRGVLNLHLRQPIKVKSILLTFTGTIHISWAQALGHGHERFYKDERTVISHQWLFLRPQYARSHHLTSGNHSYAFDLPLAGHLPESIRVAQFYFVQYKLKALIQRPHFLPNYSSQRVVHLTRHVSNSQEQAVVSVANRWTDKVDYEIALPSTLYHHGDQITVSLCIKPLIPGLFIRQLACTFKEYASCKPVNGWFNGRSRSHGKILHYVRTGRKTTTEQEPWQVQLAIPVPDTLDDVQYDTHSDTVRVRHKLKFILTIENPDGHLSELRAVLPVIIQAKPNGLLPTYDQSNDGQSFPYDPVLMVALVRQQQENDNQQQPSSSQAMQQQQQQQQCRHPYRIPGSIDHDIQQQRGTGHLDRSNTRRFAMHRMSLPLSMPSFRDQHPPLLSRLPTYDELGCH